MVYRNCLKLLQELTVIEEEIKLIKTLLKDLDIEEDEDLLIKIFKKIKS